MATASKKSLLDDPRYIGFVERYHLDITAFCIEVCNILPTVQQLEVFESVAPFGSRTSITSGHGCFALGTSIMRDDGSCAPVENIQVGDRLMGADGTSIRNVLELKRGRENMYRFTYMDGSSHTFNESHILCLVATNSKGRRVAGEKITVTVRDWLTWGEDKKRCHAIYRSRVENFNRTRKSLLIDPYVLGLWLGDGNSDSSAFTTMDGEILNAFSEYAKTIKCKITKKCPAGKAFTYNLRNIADGGFKNPMIQALKAYGLIKNKHIPDDYLFASHADRLEILAGLLDTDGHQDKGSSGFEITQKNERLAKQICWLARSVGCHATVKEVTKTCSNNGVKGQYWRCTIGRNIDQIPVRLPHKKIPSGHRQRGNLHFGIRSVEPIGEGDYYGFVLDGDSKFLGGDFTVLHNTGKTAAYSVIALWHLLCYHTSNTFLHAPKLKTITDGVWKEFASRKTGIQNGAQAWIAEYFEIESLRVYVKGFKLNWYISPRSAPKGSPENLAGAHNYALLWLLDESSGIPDANWGVISGSLTDKRNRACCASQPTRQSGFFYDQHHSLSKEEGGVWNALSFSSIDSPLVSDEFLIEKKQQYSLEEWLIKVIGQFCELAGKYLNSAAAIQACVGKKVIRDDEEYGWFLLSDIGGGGYRDDTVLLAAKVIGHGEYGDAARRVQIVSVPVCSNTKDPSDVYGDIIEESGKLSNCTAVIDGGGIGLSVIKQLEKNDFTNFVKVLWGSPNFRREYKERYVNQRAQACCGIARAVQEGRFGIDDSVPLSVVKKIIKQGSRIPYHYDEKARRYIEKKQDMATDGIPSPDLWDACSFAFLESAQYLIAETASITSSGTKLENARAAAQDAFATA